MWSGWRCRSCASEEERLCANLKSVVENTQIVSEEITRLVWLKYLFAGGQLESEEQMIAANATWRTPVMKQKAISKICLSGSFIGCLLSPAACCVTKTKAIYSRELTKITSRGRYYSANYMITCWHPNM